MSPKRLDRPENAKRIARVRRLSRRLDLPMAILSLVFLVLVVVQIALGPGDPHAPRIETAIGFIWGLFLLEFLVKLALYPDRREFLKRRWFDALVLAIPVLRVFRAIPALMSLKAVRALPLSRGLGSGMWLFRSGVALRRGGRGFGHFWERSRLGLVLALTGVVVVSGAAGMVLLERSSPQSPIRSFGDALWWSAAIVTTVASDLNPVTPMGRLLAVLMMVYGMAVFGYLVSQLVAMIQEPARRVETPPSR